MEHRLKALKDLAARGTGIRTVWIGFLLDSRIAAHASINYELAHRMGRGPARISRIEFFHDMWRVLDPG